MKGLLALAICGALGASARAAVGQILSGSTFPMGTLVVNATGSLILGLLTGISLGSDLIPEAWKVPICTGFLGSFTTFSTFAVETVRLIEEQQWKLAIINLLSQLVLGILFAFLGIAMGRMLTR